MAAGRYTSRVFVAGEALMTLLTDISYPQFQGRTPTPTFGAVDPDKDREQIGLVLTPDETAADWVNMSPSGRDEVLGIDVVHWLGNPNIKSPDAVWQRLEEVADLVQSAVYNTTTESVIALGFPGELPMGKVRSVRPEVGPTEHGYIGRCTITFEFRARI